jgi:hypothetical protein
VPIWRLSLRQGPGDPDAKAAQDAAHIGKRTRVAGSQIEGAKQGRRLGELEVPAVGLGCATMTWRPLSY